MPRPKSQHTMDKLPGMGYDKLMQPKELTFFYPPKGIDTATPLIRLPKEFSPDIRNFVLDRGILKSRVGLEAYHNNHASNAIGRTADIKGSATQSITVTNRSTTPQGPTAGWVDPDGVGNNQNEILNAGPGIHTVPESARLYVIVGDPNIGANIDAYNDLYTLSFTVEVDHGTVPTGFTVSSEVVVEASTDNGATFTVVSANYSVGTINPGILSQTHTVTVNVGIPPTSTGLHFRLRLKLYVQAGSGKANGRVFAPTAVTWQTSSGSSTPARLPTRWTKTRLQIYEDPTEVSATWTDRYTFPADQTNTDFLLPTYMIWKDTIISTDIGDTPQGAPSKIGSKGLISTIFASPHTTTILTHSPRAANLFLLGNRVIALRTNEWSAPTDPWVDGGITNISRVRWSVKNNSNDWDGLGSGFEDLVVSAGSSDEVMAGAPVTDDTGIVVSAHTIRRMDVTGFVDAPFRFGLLHESLGTICRYTVRGLPGGVIFVGYDDVFIVTLGEVKRIGSLALRESLRNISNPELATGYFDAYNSRYICAFMNGTQQELWQYSFFDQGWTRLILPYEVSCVDIAFYDINGVTFYGAYFTQKPVGGYSVRENPNRVQDVDTSAFDVDSTLEIRTGAIVVGDIFHQSHVIEAVLVYESAGAQTLLFDFSIDGGETWNNYGVATVGATVRPQNLRIRKAVSGNIVQLRVRSPTLGGLSLIALHVYGLPGGRNV